MGDRSIPRAEGGGKLDRSFREFPRVRGGFRGEAPYAPHTFTTGSTRTVFFANAATGCFCGEPSGETASKTAAAAFFAAWATPPSGEALLFRDLKSSMTLPTVVARRRANRDVPRAERKQGCRQRQVVSTRA